MWPWPPPTSSSIFGSENEIPTAKAQYRNSGFEHSAAVLQQIELVRKNVTDASALVEREHALLTNDTCLVPIGPDFFAFPEANDRDQSGPGLENRDQSGRPTFFPMSSDKKPVDKRTPKNLPTTTETSLLGAGVAPPGIFSNDSESSDNEGAAEKKALEPAEKFRRLSLSDHIGGLLRPKPPPRHLTSVPGLASSSTVEGAAPLTALFSAAVVEVVKAQFHPDNCSFVSASLSEGTNITLSWMPVRCRGVSMPRGNHVPPPVVPGGFAPAFQPQKRASLLATTENGSSFFASLLATGEGASQVQEGEDAMDEEESAFLCLPAPPARAGEHSANLGYNSYSPLGGPANDARDNHIASSSSAARHARYRSTFLQLSTDVLRGSCPTYLTDVHHSTMYPD